MAGPATERPAPERPPGGPLSSRPRRRSTPRITRAITSPPAPRPPWAPHRAWQVCAWARAGGCVRCLSPGVGREESAASSWGAGYILCLGVCVSGGFLEVFLEEAVSQPGFQSQHGRGLGGRTAVIMLCEGEGQRGPSEATEGHWVKQAPVGTPNHSHVGVRAPHRRYLSTNCMLRDVSVKGVGFSHPLQGSFWGSTKGRG